MDLLTLQAVFGWVLYSWGRFFFANTNNLVTIWLNDFGFEFSWIFLIWTFNWICRVRSYLFAFMFGRISIFWLFSWFILYFDRKRRWIWTTHFFFYLLYLYSWNLNFNIRPTLLNRHFFMFVLLLHIP